MWLSKEALIDNSKIQAPLEAGEAPCEFFKANLPIGENIQRSCLIASLPMLGNEEAACNRGSSNVNLGLPSAANTEFHEAASSTFKTILKDKLVHPRTFTQTFLQSILSSIDSRDSVVANAWLETLLDVIDLLPVDVINSDILPIAIAKGQLSQHVNCRLTSCKLLGKICSQFDQQMLRKEALPLVLSLCQDVKAEVRACICLQLPQVAKVLGPDAVKPGVLTLLVELASDEEAQVRLAAVEAIVNMMQYLQYETLKWTIVPLVVKICETALAAEDEVMVMVSKVFGELCLGLDKVLTIEEKKWFLQHYQQLAQLGVRVLAKRFYSMMSTSDSNDNSDKYLDCLHNCAFHFPAMTVFATSNGENLYQQLSSTFTDLVCTPYFLVRRTVACGIHEVARILTFNEANVKLELMKLLRDDVGEVLNGLVPHLSKTLSSLVKSRVVSPDTMDNAALDIGRSLVQCEAKIASTHDWRLHEMLFNEFECLPQVLPSEFLYTYFIPIVLSRIHSARQLPVRLAASRCLLILLRYNLKASQRKDIRTRLVDELCRSRSCYKRMSYIKICLFALDIFSKKYFKEHFFSHLLKHGEDCVINNRLVFVELLPRLKSCLRLPSDKKLLTSLESCIGMLMSAEKDRDVSGAVRRAIQQLDMIEVLQDNEQKCNSDEQEDERRLEEENRIDTMCFLGQGETGAIPTGIIGITGRQTYNEVLAEARQMHPQNLNSTSQPTSRVSSPQHTTYSGPGTPRLNRKNPAPSLEEEFFVDAGIKIPHHFTNAVVPSRIPNIRQHAFLDKGTENIGKQNYFDRLEKSQQHSYPGSHETAMLYEPQTYLDDKLDYKRPAAPVTLKSLLRSPTTGRHSFMENNNKPSNVTHEESNKVATTLDNSSKRHSYIEKLQIATHDKNEVKKVGYQRRSLNFTSTTERLRGSGVEKRWSMISVGKLEDRVKAEEKGQENGCSLEQIKINGNEKMTDKRRSFISLSKQEGVQDKVIEKTEKRRSMSYLGKLGSQVTDENSAERPRSFVSKNKMDTVKTDQGKINEKTDNRRSTSYLSKAGNHSSADEKVTEKSRGFLSTSKHDSARIEQNKASEKSEKRRSMSYLGKHDDRSLDKSKSGVRESNRRSMSFLGKHDEPHGFSRMKTSQISREDLLNDSSANETSKTRLQSPGFILKNHHASDERLQISRSVNSSPNTSRASSPMRVKLRTAPSSRSASPTGIRKRLSLGVYSTLKLTEPTSKDSGKQTNLGTYKSLKVGEAPCKSHYIRAPSLRPGSPMGDGYISSRKATSSREASPIADSKRNGSKSTRSSSAPSTTTLRLTVGIYTGLKQTEASSRLPVRKKMS